jgi:hypothetical protein
MESLILLLRRVRVHFEALESRGEAVESHLFAALKNAVRRSLEIHQNFRQTVGG